MAGLQHAHLQQVYRLVSLAFVVLVLGVGGGVAYAGFSRTTVLITPKLLPVSANFTVTVAPTAKDASTIVGSVNHQNQSATVTVTPSTGAATTPAHAAGQVTFTNQTASAQPLAVGTRLKASNGVIVRTSKRVDVPAGGTVTAPVVADPLGADGNLPPGHFTIVALWSGLQSKIFADSASAFTGGLTSGASTLSLDQLNTASDQASQQLRSQLPPSTAGTLVTTTPVGVTTTPPADTPSASYQVTVTLKVLTITFQPSDLPTMVRHQLTSGLATDQQLTSIATPTITAGDQPTADSINLTVAADGLATIAATSPDVQANNFLGLSGHDITARLLGNNAVKSVTIHFSPWWRTTAPTRARQLTVKLLPAQS